MKNKDNWTPTRVLKKQSSFVLNPQYVGSGSLYVFELQLKTYVALFQKHCSGNLLDCGCGQIPYYEVYKGLVDTITCTDWENTYNKTDFIDIYSDLNEKLNVDSNTYDTIILTDVINHIHNPKILMNEIARALKKGGKLILTTPFLYWINEKPYDYHRYTKYELAELCKENNLKVIELKEYGGFPDILFDLGNKILPNKKWLINLYLKSVNLLSKTFIYRRLSKYNEKFPLGYYLIAEKC